MDSHLALFENFIRFCCCCCVFCVLYFVFFKIHRRPFSHLVIKFQICELINVCNGPTSKSKRTRSCREWESHKDLHKSPQPICPADVWRFGFVLCHLWTFFFCLLSRNQKFVKIQYWFNYIIIPAVKSHICTQLSLSLCLSHKNVGVEFRFSCDQLMVFKFSSLNLRLISWNAPSAFWI